MGLAVPDDPFGINDEQRPVGNAYALIQDPEGLRSTTMGPEVRKQRMANATHCGSPSLKRKRRVHAHAEQLCTFFIKLFQRTVESGSLIASATGECKRESV